MDKQNPSPCIITDTPAPSMPLSQFISCRNPKSRIVTEHGYNRGDSDYVKFRATVAAAICTNRESERCRLIQCNKVPRRTAASFAHRNNRYVNNIWDYTRKWPRNFGHRRGRQRTVTIVVTRNIGTRAQS